MIGEDHARRIDMTQSSEQLSGTAPHILVVDDDTRIRELLKRFLMENGYMVTIAKDAAQARQFLEGLSFDLLVLDVMMPGESGLDLAQSLRDSSNVPILMLTARGEAEDRIAGLERGVDDYLPKPFEPRELLLRIGSIMRRARSEIEERTTIRMGPCQFDIERGELSRDNDPIRLTNSEVALLQVLASSPGATFSRMDLSEQTGTGLERSIDVQITRLRKKIETNPKIPRYLQTVRGKGYMLVPD